MAQSETDVVNYGNKKEPAVFLSHHCVELKVPENDP
jgi:hypothetical protein